ncbi:MAG: hypothetical protein ACTS4Z_01225 [Candidatus Hodgkinia cicadicola]
MKPKRNLVREDKPSLYINVRKGSLESQVLEHNKRLVIVAAHGRKIHCTTVANELARRCLAVGVFQLSFEGTYKGVAIKFIKALRYVGIEV